MGLSRIQAAEYWGISPTLFDIGVAEGWLPRARRVKGHRRKMWLRHELEEAALNLPVEGDSDSDEGPWSRVKL
jgi:hypothetical protein